MTAYDLLAPNYLAYAVVLAISLRVIWQTRRERAAARAEFEREMAELQARRAARLAAEAGSDPPAVLRLALDFGTGDDLPDLTDVPREAKGFLDGLSRYEATAGGRGLTLTAAECDPGRVTLTLTPKDPAGSADRLRRVAEALNAAFDAGEPAPDLGPLPGGVVGARASTALAA